MRTILVSLSIIIEIYFITVVEKALTCSFFYLMPPKKDRTFVLPNTSVEIYVIINDSKCLLILITIIYFLDFLAV